MAVTIHEVAKLAGVNSSTVSRVINGKATITPDTKGYSYDTYMELVNKEATKERPGDLNDALKYAQQGYKAVVLPSYDNTQNLMAYLNAVLGSTPGYDIAFEPPTLNEKDSTVHRSGTISFDTNTYAEARSIIQSIAHGPYPCQVDEFGITDTTKQKNRSKDKPPVSTKMEITFFEKPTKDMSLQNDESKSEGQDLSKMKDWNK